MSDNDYYSPERAGSSVTVSVDVTRIVKYLCIAGTFIVSVIFFTKYCHKQFYKGLIE